MNTEITDRFRGVIRQWAEALAGIEWAGPNQASILIGIEKGIDRTVFDLSLGRFDGFGKDEYEAVRAAAHKLAAEMLEGGEQE